MRLTAHILTSRWVDPDMMRIHVHFAGSHKVHSPASRSRVPSAAFLDTGAHQGEFGHLYSWPPDDHG